MCRTFNIKMLNKETTRHVSYPARTVHLLPRRFVHTCGNVRFWLFLALRDPVTPGITSEYNTQG